MGDDYSDFLKKAEIYFFRIRRKIISVFFVFLIGAVLGGVNYQKIVQFLFSSFKFQDASLVLSSPSQIIGLVFSISFFVGIFSTFFIVFSPS